MLVRAIGIGGKGERMENFEPEIKIIMDYPIWSKSTACSHKLKVG